mmetsp:Transcript_31029/g.56257  ORF Transcript_31029/g.56257 Transcript_31029/m.56257 type:complete len:203 (-) Transcript_31029:846-1454(-)
MAESKARKRLVARKKMDRSARRRSLIAVNIAVVSIRLSIPSPGVSRSRQNSSISSNRITVSSNASRRSKTYRILAATLVSPSAKKTDVSITRKSHPKASASDSQIVVLAVPGGPKRMAEYAAPYDGLAMPFKKGMSTRFSKTHLSVVHFPFVGSPRSVSRRRFHFVGDGPSTDKLLPLNSFNTSSCINVCIQFRIRITQVSV